MDDVMKLISTTTGKDENGITRTTYGEPREVMCQVDSITRAEFFEAGRNGLNPEFKFRMFFGDYHGERVVEYHGLRYSIYRTYHGRGDIIELYAERRGGTNGN
jgi:SPP1 family predicted phage head-tail adaptor